MLYPHLSEVPCEVSPEALLTPAGRDAPDAHEVVGVRVRGEASGGEADEAPVPREAEEG